MSKEKRCGSTGGWGRCMSLLPTDVAHQQKPTSTLQELVFNPEGVGFWHPNSHPFKARLGGSKNGKFLLCFFFFRYPKMARQRGHLERNEKLSDTTWNLKGWQEKIPEVRGNNKKNFPTLQGTFESMIFRS